MMMMRGVAAMAAWLVSTAAWAGTTTHALVWDVTVGDQPIGTRTATIEVEREGTKSTRVISAFTNLDATVGPVAWSYKQRLTVVADNHPAAFHAVMKEDGEPREVQARWRAGGWTITIADRRGGRTIEASPQRIDLSTADLMDPESTARLSDFTSVKVLSAETGDVWEGAVTPMGSARVRVGGEVVEVQGYRWDGPSGPSTFWYDPNGWLVQYETTLLGRRIAGTLREAPPKGPDVFAVRVGGARVEVRELP